MLNKYGLDASYFRKNLKILLRDIDNYSAPEMYRALTRLAAVANPSKPEPPEDK